MLIKVHGETLKVCRLCLLVAEVIHSVFLMQRHVEILVVLLVFIH